MTTIEADKLGGRHVGGHLGYKDGSAWHGI